MIIPLIDILVNDEEKVTMTIDLSGKICQITKGREDNLGADLDIKVQHSKFRK